MARDPVPNNDITNELRTILQGYTGQDIRMAIHDALSKLWSYAESKNGGGDTPTPVPASESRFLHGNMALHYENKSTVFGGKLLDLSPDSVTRTQYFPLYSLAPPPDWDTEYTTYYQRTGDGTFGLIPTQDPVPEYLSNKYYDVDTSVLSTDIDYSAEPIGDFGNKNKFRFHLVCPGQETSGGYGYLATTVFFDLDAPVFLMRVYYNGNGGFTGPYMLTCSDKIMTFFNRGTEASLAALEAKTRDSLTFGDEYYATAEGSYYVYTGWDGTEDKPIWSELSSVIANGTIVWFKAVMEETTPTHWAPMYGAYFKYDPVNHSFKRRTDASDTYVRGQYYTMTEAAASSTLSQIAMYSGSSGNAFVRITDKIDGQQWYGVVPGYWVNGNNLYTSTSPDDWAPMDITLDASTVDTAWCSNWSKTLARQILSSIGAIPTYILVESATAPEDWDTHPEKYFELNGNGDYIPLSQGTVYAPVTYYKIKE